MTETNNLAGFSVQINEEETWDYSIDLVVVVSHDGWQMAWHLSDGRVCDYVSNNIPDEENTRQDMEEAFSQVQMHFRLMNPCVTHNLCDVVTEIDGRAYHQEWLDSIELPF